jgi:hypothetical protein
MTVSFIVGADIKPLAERINYPVLALTSTLGNPAFDPHAFTA